ncbi:hypothetical protein AB0D49_39410 [Streptomyces sp. NPDC048290]|uniref:hypothetical protein n=1 Tax=Streptomyces sp. NPDC048290 TaxID=3155811 RepID=UPI00343A46F7
MSTPTTKTTDAAFSQILGGLSGHIESMMRTSLFVEDVRLELNANYQGQSGSAFSRNVETWMQKFRKLMVDFERLGENSQIVQKEFNEGEEQARMQGESWLDAGDTVGMNSAATDTGRHADYVNDVLVPKN